MQKLSKHKLLVRRLVFAQLALIISLPMIFYIKGQVFAYSVLIGTLISFVPNLYFVYRVFKYQGARSARKILQSFYAGESIKLLLTALFFGLAFALIEPLNVLAVFIGFISIQATSWLTPWLTLRKTS
jgi:ATP synthase protein I